MPSTTLPRRSKETRRKKIRRKVLNRIVENDLIRRVSYDKYRELVRLRNRSPDEDGVSVFARRAFCALKEGAESGEWFDGIPWTTNINVHDAGATILAVPEPTTFLLLGLAPLLLRKRR